jgi:hypothetical protein
LSKSASSAFDAAEVTLSVGDRSTQLRLAADDDKVSWKTPVATANALKIVPAAPAAALGFVAELSYDEDIRGATAKAIGLALQRRYEVLADGHWSPVAEHPVAEGDWVRITLRVDNPALRRHVALTDEMPGGLRPTDLRLSGVAGLDVKRVADEGSVHFRARRLDSTSPKFYAEVLPPGTHEVHYFARVTLSGQFLAPPAVAEIMYGSVGRARSDAAELEVRAPANAKVETGSAAQR